MSETGAAATGGTSATGGTGGIVGAAGNGGTGVAPAGGVFAGEPQSPTPAALRNALGRFATGVTIVSTLDAAGAAVGLTANSFQSLSLEPPLVLWSLRRSSPSLAAFLQATHFAVNVLAEAQVDLSRSFASRRADKFADGAWSAGAHGGIPVLAGSAAVFECAAFSQQDAGDHVLFIGRVLATSEAPVPPLLFQAGHYRMLGEVL